MKQQIFTIFFAKIILRLKAKHRFICNLHNRLHRLWEERCRLLRGLILKFKISNVLLYIFTNCILLLWHHFVKLVYCRSLIVHSYTKIIFLIIALMYLLIYFILLDTLLFLRLLNSFWVWLFCQRCYLLLELFKETLKNLLISWQSFYSNFSTSPLIIN